MTACILQDYRTDRCVNCTHLCPHRVAFHGLNDNGGRTADVKTPKDYRHVTLSTSPCRKAQSDIYRKLDVYASTFKRHLTGGERAKSLYLWSESPGTGKTTTAAALLNAWIASEYLVAIKDGEQPSQTNAYFLDVTELQTSYNLATMTKDESALKAIGKQISDAQQASFAVLDDIGVRKATEAFRAYIHALINHRTASGLPTVYTSNLDISEMATVFDDRLYDRIRDQCAIFEFDGESKRGRR